MNITKLIIDDKKVPHFIQLGLGIIMVLFSTFRYLFEPPTTSTIVMSIAFSIQGICFIFLGSSFRKIIFEKDGDQLKIRWSHSFEKKAFSDNWINEVSIGTSYIFIKPLEGDMYKHSIEPLKPKSREALIQFFHTHFPDRLKIR